MSLCLHNAPQSPMGDALCQHRGWGFSTLGSAALHGGCWHPPLWWLWVPLLLGADVNAALRTRRDDPGGGTGGASWCWHPMWDPWDAWMGDGAASLSTPRSPGGRGTMMGPHRWCSSAVPRWGRWCHRGSPCAPHPFPKWVQKDSYRPHCGRFPEGAVLEMSGTQPAVAERPSGDWGPAWKRHRSAHLETMPRD